jgi:hypothetical protein
MKNHFANESLPIGRDSQGKVTGVIEIVAHSLGYAYALGMIEKIKAAGFKLGRFYIIAPENASSGQVNLADFEEVWQYGSDNKRDDLWEQDGIAPQSAVVGLPDDGTIENRFGRVYIPKNDPNRDFVGAHSISSYGWIFLITNPQTPGYVRNR